MKRTFTCLLSLLLVAAFILSCAQKVPETVRETVVKQETTVVKETVPVPVPAERTRVAFWHIFGSGPGRDAFDKVVADFNVSNPSYIVEPVFTDFWTYDQKVLAAVAAGDPPDVIMGDQTRAGQRAEAKQIIALDEYIKADSFDMAAFWEYPQKDVAYKGQIWGIPYAPDTRVLFYDKAAFREVGLDPDAPPKTWDELWEYALKLDQKDDKGDLVRVGFNPMWGNCWMMPFLFSNGAALVDENNKFLFNAPEVVETATWYKTWVDHYGKEELDNFASGFGPGAQDPFMSGQVAMIVQVQDYIGNLQTYTPDKEWGVALVPYNKTPASWGAGFDLEIPFGAKNPDGAWEFIKYLTSKDIQITTATASGWMPSRIDASQDPALASTPGWDVVLESMKVTRSRRFVLEAPTWYNPLVTAIQEVWDGVKTPEQALNDAQAEVEKEVENYKATH